ncbi:hypothetical protein GM921_15115 [Pedobacter sp. LMG 31464]|uniref:Methyltransferase domain-containing protein n=1 Tax=Pedobacter planticolens TaxID=2679964 RepID=A0A923IXY3_9SPHI|nr:hypothetical protein [Pedobacter planticolens]MBB2146832.1 hypothetical protein [Pedobacter planticolens]
MTLLDRLSDAATNAVNLEKFALNNSQEIHDWFNLEPHSFIRENQEIIRQFVLGKWQVIRKLDPNKRSNLSLFAILLDVCERIGDLGCFLRLYSLLSQTPFDLGSRLKASALFMVNVSTAEDYLDRVQPIYELLKFAYEEEEERQDRVLGTFINYFAQVVINFGQFNPGIAKSIIEKIKTIIKEDEFSFLNHPLIFSVIETDLTDYEIAYSHINLLLDTYLNRAIHSPQTEYGLLKEADSAYSISLAEVNKEFDAIRAISVAKHLSNPNKEQAFRSLINGTKIIDDESLLYAYMHALGPMHSAKLTSAFPFLDFSTFKESVGIVDWGCGQGTGSMVLLDHILSKGIPLNIESITLVEPSTLALKRASLHADKYIDTTRLVTINKLINDIVVDDFNPKEGIYIHLFSNILDIEQISLKFLTDLIKQVFKGVNYFICLGPYQNDIKRDRLDAFMLAFVDNHLEQLAIENNRAYEWLAEKKWTRVMRVFKAKI